MALGHSAFGIDAFEMQVYDGDINRVGDFTIESHTNTVIKGTNSPPASTAELSENHLTHHTLHAFKFAEGMTPYWELGA